eukprot:576481-Rhodomonas_salina.2
MQLALVLLRRFCHLKCRRNLTCGLSLKTTTTPSLTCNMDRSRGCCKEQRRRGMGKRPTCSERRERRCWPATSQELSERPTALRLWVCWARGHEAMTPAFVLSRSLMSVFPKGQSVSSFQYLARLRLVSKAPRGSISKYFRRLWLANGIAEASFSSTFQRSGQTTYSFDATVDRTAMSEWITLTWEHGATSIDARARDSAS